MTSKFFGEFADRIIPYLSSPPHSNQTRVRLLNLCQQCVLNVSCVDVSIGLSGANIKAGIKVDSLIRGGTAFTTGSMNCSLWHKKTSLSYL
ncbi:hypothetical protein OH492_25510 [Vibrio chagasii]|nr:hypothetical protein [Vibrio chagasii]